MIQESELSVKSRNSNPEDVVTKFIDGFNRHDGSVMDLFAKDNTWLDPGALEPEGGWERMQKGVLSAYKVFPDIRLEPSHIMARGDWVCFEGMFTGTFKGGKLFANGKDWILPPTNTPVKLSTAWFFRVNANCLISYWSFYWDNLRFLAQIGLRPEQIGMSSNQ
jgi:predicted ester cyclase